MLNSHLDMRLRMIMKAPVCRTAAGVESFLSDSQLAATRTLQFSHRGLVGHIWRQYADSLISNTDSGMECCESAEEILRELAAAPGRPAITRTGRSRWPRVIAIASLVTGASSCLKTKTAASIYIWIPPGRSWTSATSAPDQLRN